MLDSEYQELSLMSITLAVSCFLNKSHGKLLVKSLIKENEKLLRRIFLKRKRELINNIEITSY